MNSLEQIRDAIFAAKTIIVAAHISPDSDAVGSCLGLVRLLNSIDKSATAYLFDKIPQRLKPLVKDSPVVHQLPSAGVDLFISVDTATKNRLGDHSDALMKLAKKTIVIDHHISNPGYGDLNFIDANSASASSIILHLGKLLSATFDQTSLNLLLAGLMDDTGSFRYGNTTDRVFLEAAEIVKLGAQPEVVSELLYFSSPLKYLKLKSKVVETIELAVNSEIAIGCISLKTLAELNCTKEDADGLIEVLRSIENTKGAVFLRELEAGKWKASIRSKQGSFDANIVAGKFGGGGHLAAAGCTIELPLDEAKKQLEAEIAKVLS
jgi:phosphoesterase RecJ-like protein